MLVKIARQGTITGQTTQLVELPDIQGEVLQIWAIYFDLQSVSEATTLIHTLWHDINMGTTLQSSDVAGQWCHVEQGHISDGPRHEEVRFSPEPYELIGPQRWDCNPSNGTITVYMTIHYTIRKERNVVRWNLLRARTSHERD